MHSDWESYEDAFLFAELCLHEGIIKVYLSSFKFHLEGEGEDSPDGGPFHNWCIGFSFIIL